jgi:hypothetical protein
MIEVHVLRVASLNAMPESLGEHKFLALPRVGDLIRVMDDNKDVALVVEAIEHTSEPPAPFVGDAGIALFGREADA